MEQDEVVVLLTRIEALQTIAAIKESIVNTRKLIVDFYQREGWKSLGYGSFESCIETEFGKSVSYVYRQLSAGLTEMRLPIGEIGDNKESHLRKLSILDNDDQIQQAWQLAQAMSDSPTALVFEQAAKTIWVNENCDLPMLRQRMLAGKITPNNAYKIARYLSDKPMDMVEVGVNVTDPQLLPMLYRLRNEDSSTWEEIAFTQHIPSVDEQIPISEASPQNLKAYLVIASNEHRAIAIEENREHFAMLRETVDEIIEEARRVDRMDYPRLHDALGDYDRLMRSKRVQGG
jgi:hypothetical protein